MSAVLLAKWHFIQAMQSARAKDPNVNYLLLQTDRTKTLLYNPATEDGMIVSRLRALPYLHSGYYEAWPQIDYSLSLERNNARLAAKGWPKIEGI